VARHATPTRPRGGSAAEQRLPRLPLAVLAAALFVAVFTENAPVGLLPLLAEAFAVGEDRAGLWVSAYAIVVAVAAVPLTAVLARWPKRRALLALLAVYGASNLVILVAPSYGVGLVGRVIGGVAHAGIFTVTIAAAAALAPEGKKARAIAVVNGGGILALALGLPLSTALATAWGWRVPFAVATAMTLLLIVAAGRALPVTTSGSTGGAPVTARDVLAALRGRGLQLIGLITVVATVGQSIAYTYIAPTLIAAGVDQDRVSVALLAYGLACGLGLVVAGGLADRFPTAMLRGGIALAVVALVALTVTSSPVAAVAAVALWGLAFGLFPTLLNSHALKVSSVPDAAPAVVNATFNLGIATGAWLGGPILLTHGTTWVTGVGATVMLASLPLMLLRARPAQQAG
jgi:MFS transporter, DHA1 family, inner membrane transport protein